MRYRRIKNYWWYPVVPTEPEEAAEKAEIIAGADCSSDAIPEHAESKDGQKKVRIPVLKSMKQYLFKRYRKRMYSFINHLLWRGELLKLTGYDVNNKAFNKDTLTFPYPGVTFWRIDREDFYADVNVRLALETPNGNVIWNGILVIWCSFEDKFSCEIEYLTDHEDRESDDFIKLDNYLIPICTNGRMDEIGEKIWKEYKMEEALTMPSQRVAEKLAEAVGLRIEYHPIYDHMGVSSILFFIEDDLYIGEDRVERKDGKVIRTMKALNGRQIRIPANTIVINTNIIRREYSGFNIYHEIIHYLMHYLFFRLQELTTNDPRKIETIEITEEEYKKNKDPIFFAEKQADRGAFALMMPVSDTRARTAKLMSKEREAVNYKNTGEFFEAVGIGLAREMGMPHFRVKARLVQLGYYEMKGTLNYVDRNRIHPFAFHREAWKIPEHTFVVRPAEVKRIEEDNQDFKKIMESGDYVYADGHVVINNSRFVTERNGVKELTEEALSCIDNCCLRFVRTYTQDYPGSYVFGRMFHDPHAIKQTEFYLSDLINQEHLSLLQAKMQYEKNFPGSFKKAFTQVMKQSGDTQESMAEKLHTTDKTLRKWIDDPDGQLTADFVIRVSLIWELPSWMSALLLDSGGKGLSKKNPRHQALEYIRTFLWDQGIDEANKYLLSNGMEPLKI